jgi:hypothetical protein
MLRTTRRSLLLGAVVAIAATGVSAHRWVSLAANALTYKEIRRGEAANLVAQDSLIYATMADDGLAIIDARSGRTLGKLSPAAGSESIDDVAIANGLLFALDARPPGHLSVYSLRDPLNPRLVAAPHEVPVGPFSGVSAGDGLCIVSGGTSQLTAWRYDTDGALTGPVATADLGRGQPDVLVARDGKLAYVATHYRGPDFGLDIIRVASNAGGAIETISALPLDGAGFTAGGAKPANFPIDVASLDDSTVLVAFARGVAVIDAARPAHPRVERVIDVGGPAVNIDVVGSAVAVTVSGRSPAIVLLDFSATPRVVRRIPLAPGTLPLGVALLTSTVAAAVRDRGVLVFDR